MILHLSFTLIFLDIRGGREDLNLKFGDLKGKNLSKRYPDLNLFAFFQFMEDRNLGENMYLKVFKMKAILPSLFAVICAKVTHSTYSRNTRVS